MFYKSLAKRKSIRYWSTPLSVKVHGLPPSSKSPSFWAYVTATVFLFNIKNALSLHLVKKRGKRATIKIGHLVSADFPKDTEIIVG